MGDKYPEIEEEPRRLMKAVDAHGGMTEPLCRRPHTAFSPMCKNNGCSFFGCMTGDPETHFGLKQQYGDAFAALDHIIWNYNIRQGATGRGKYSFREFMWKRYPQDADRIERFCALDQMLVEKAP